MAQSYPSRHVAPLDARESFSVQAESLLPIEAVDLTIISIVNVEENGVFRPEFWVCVGFRVRPGTQPGRVRVRRVLNDAGVQGGDLLVSQFDGDVNLRYSGLDDHGVIRAGHEEENKQGQITHGSRH